MCSPGAPHNAAAVRPHPGPTLTLRGNSPADRTSLFLSLSNKIKINNNNNNNTKNPCTRPFFKKGFLRGNQKACNQDQTALWKHTGLLLEVYCKQNQAPFTVTSQAFRMCKDMNSTSASLYSGWMTVKKKKSTTNSHIIYCHQKDFTSNYFGNKQIQNKEDSRPKNVQPWEISCLRRGGHVQCSG